MAKVKVRVLNATVDGHKPGSVISIDEKSADYYEKIRYVARVGKQDEKKADNTSDKGGE